MRCSPIPLSALAMLAVAVGASALPIDEALLIRRGFNFNLGGAFKSSLPSGSRSEWTVRDSAGKFYQLANKQPVRYFDHVQAGRSAPAEGNYGVFEDLHKQARAYDHHGNAYDLKEVRETKRMFGGFKFDKTKDNHVQWHRHIYTTPPEQRSPVVVPHPRTY